MTAKPATPVLPREVSLLRIVAQGLVGATAAPSAAEAVRRQLAIQGQQVSAVPHALVVRVVGATGSDVAAAFARGDLVRSWPMRGTVHITTAADHHWLRVALMHRLDAWVRRSEAELGISQALCEHAAEIALAAIRERGPLPRAELLDAWAQAGLMAFAAGKDVSAYRRRHLLVRLQREGVLVQGPRRGNEHLVVDAAPFPSADSGPAGAGVARGQPGHTAALAEIARRYATSHGPISAGDLARWTTLPKREAARALENAVEETTATSYRADTARARVPLVRARADGGVRGRLRILGVGESAPRTGLLYLRADLPELLEAARRQALAARFLASFDELHVGYKDRSCLTGEAGERLICPAANGMFRPLLVDRGRLVGVRPVGEGVLWLDGAAPSARVERDITRAVAAVEKRLAR
ncbi:DNA glycosylase AlkZ-like family protein [Actinomyces oricola]|uniref:DNA glycosylase AlkZ-like family protein n=1 Tax=Actinomyces oricola TaxID=206043 RepID=UPI000FFE5A58|nr:crosslink repair DNA glycosylase YcaQ family protein [Actinomyces oricola]